MEQVAYCWLSRYKAGSTQAFVRGPQIHTWCETVNMHGKFRMCDVTYLLCTLNAIVVAHMYSNVISFLRVCHYRSISHSLPSNHFHNALPAPVCRQSDHIHRATAFAHFSQGRNQGGIDLMSRRTNLFTRASQIHLPPRFILI